MSSSEILRLENRADSVGKVMNEFHFESVQVWVHFSCIKKGEFGDMEFGWGVQECINFIFSWSQRTTIQALASYFSAAL